jgi:predicted small metal-binding protein
LRVIDCAACAATITAANDQELTAHLRDHLATDHPEMELSDEELKGLVASRAYEASDA